MLSAVDSLLKLIGKKLKTKKLKGDKFAKREAKKYSNPVVSREFILEFLSSASGPMTHKALCREFSVTNDEQIEALRRRLIAMERDGQLISNRKGAYGCIDKMDLIKGKVIGHRDGYGFVEVGDGSDDIYISNRQMRKVFTGDDVLVRADGTDVKGRREGAIVQVLSHNTHSLVGRYFFESGIHFVRADNPKVVHDIILQPQHIGDAKNGQFVEVSILAQPESRRPPSGQIKAVLGDHLAPGMEIDVAIRSHDLPHVWPQAVANEVEQIPAEVQAEDSKNRHDLRHIPFVTIDGEDARDFDDAVYCEPKKSGGWRLYVAIADVSHYVQVGSALDDEAKVRGNSVYFPDHVLPMLPEALSNGLCSLNPNVDRLCMVCEISVSAQGRIGAYVFYEGVMHSHARLTYTKVGAMLGADTKQRTQLRDEYALVVPHIESLNKLYAALRSQRDRRGAIDFESTETRIEFDENRKIQQIVPVQRNDAHKIIEECMLAANVCAAKFLEAMEIPGLYRVHESPKPEKVEMLRQYLNDLGLNIRLGKTVSVQDFQSVLDSIVDRPDKQVIQTVLLRSMNQAVYQVENKGHFGLAYQAYAHFTSPIRRYPDLLMHRAIRRVLRSRLNTKLVRKAKGAKALKKDVYYPYEISDLVAAGEQCSLTERRADEATRDVVSWLKCEFLQDKVGDEFNGVVSAVTGFGLFVELTDLYVEGLVHITALAEDYYHFEPAKHRLVGERTKRSYSLGDQLKVRVARVDLDERKVDFDLADQKPRKRNVKKTSGAKVGAARNSSKSKKPSSKPSAGKSSSKKPAAKPKAVKKKSAQR